MHTQTANDLTSATQGAINAAADRAEDGPHDPLVVWGRTINLGDAKHISFDLEEMTVKAIYPNGEEKTFAVKKDEVVRFVTDSKYVMAEINMGQLLFQ